MKACGILIAKKNSERFPDKNYLLFRENAEILIWNLGVENVYMATDDERIKKECEGMGILVIDRGINIKQDDQSYLEVLKYAYYSINKKYDIVVTIICNAINHDRQAIRKGLRMIGDNKKINEIRSFDIKGNQSGIFIFKELPEKWYHMGAVQSNGKEIHYRKELNERTEMD